MAGRNDLEAWLNHRIIHDGRLLFEEFLVIDWIVVAVYGFLLGLCFGWGFWRISRKRISLLKVENEALSQSLELLRRKDTIPDLPPAPVPKGKGEPKTIVEPELELEPKAPLATPPKAVPKPLPPDAKPFEAGDYVVFVMDVSRSMKKYLKYCKYELRKGVEDLRDLDQPRYQVIFFSGPAWFAHQEIRESGGANDPVVIVDPENDNFQMKWNPVPNRLNTFEYQEDVENLKGEWRKATDEDIEKTIRQIERVPRSYGTTWHRPLIMAMNLEPPPKRIQFLTDGQVANQMQVAEGIVSMVKRRGGKTIINTFGPYEASESLRYIAGQTGGEYTEFGYRNRAGSSSEEDSFLPGMEGVGS